MDKMQSMPERCPIDGTFELTVRCNLRCKMCLFRHEDCENSQLMKDEMLTAQWIRLAEEAASAGTVSLLVTGGEPMLRSDFCEIWKGIYRQGFLITLYTNATLVNDEIFETLKKFPPHRIGVTIYGASEKTYEKVCGDAKAFGKMLDGVRRLITLPSMLEFRTTIIKDNYEDVDEIERLIHESFGSQYILKQSRIVTKPVRGACGDISCRLEPVDNVRLAYRRAVNTIKQKVGDRFREENVYIQYIEQPEQKADIIHPTLLGCSAGMSSYTISYDGKLFGCQMLDAFQTDALGEGFEKAWEKFPFQVRIPPLNEQCRNCEIIDFCKCCFASRYAETGDLGGLPEYVCRDTNIVKHLIEKGGFIDENE